MKIFHLYISPGHNYFGHHGRASGENEIVEVPDIECVAGEGIRGDRFFNYKEDYRGQITFFSQEVYAELCKELEVTNKAPGVFRRNVIVSGVDLNLLIGKTFEVQGVRFLGTAECTPCYWMDEAFCSGAEKCLKGRGGLRAKILSNGILTVDAPVV